MSPIDRSLYPPDWPAISARIRHERAADRCECDGRCGSPTCTALLGAVARCYARNGRPHPVTGSRVVLTVAHLDHALTDHSDGNLAAMCQACHLAYDRPHRTPRTNP